MTARRLFMVVLFVGLTCTKYTQTKEHEYAGGDFLSLFGASSFRDMNYTETLEAGFKHGLAKSITNATSHTINSLLSSPLQKVQTMCTNTWHALMRSLHGVQGFAVSELFAIKFVVERGVETHIKKVAKGARVVRAHVLEQQITDTQQAQTKPVLFGVQSLKADLLFVKKYLAEHMDYYTQTAPTEPRCMRDRVLDYTAAALGVGSIWYTVSGKSPDFYDRRAVANQEALSKLHAGSVFAMREGAVTSGLVPELNVSKVRAIQRDVHDFEETREFQDSYKAEALRWITYASYAFAAWRVAKWLTAKTTPARIDMLRGIDRPTIAHLTKSALEATDHLIELCDQIHEEGDIARLKDDFEFVSTHCSDMFMQMAMIIDQPEMERLRRLGKPGQAATSLAQPTAGYANALPAY